MHDILSFDYSNGYDFNEVRIKLGSGIFHMLEAISDLNSTMQKLKIIRMRELMLLLFSII